MKSLRRALAWAAFCSLLSFVFYPAAFAQQTPDMPGQAAKADPDSILLTVTVMDKKGNYVGGLDKSAFTAYDNKVPQEISFFNAQDEPASVGIIFDFSSSVIYTDREQLAEAVNALSRFIKLGHDANEYFVIGFATRPRLLVDWGRADKVLEEIRGKLGPFEKEKEATALYDACYLGIEKLRDRPHARRALLVISDGQDSISDYSFKDVRERLRETGVLFYSVGIVEGGQTGSSLAMEGTAVLNEFSTVSGGVAVFPDSKKKLNATFDQIAVELRHQYVLGFKPQGVKTDGKLHQLKVKVTPPPSMSKLFSRSRDGYYAAKVPR
jgi:Ca-activated chloride channel family protein